MFSEDEMQKQKSQERRKAGRITCAQARCQFGDLRDLSRDGCRVLAKKPLTLPEGASVNLIFKAQGASLKVPGRPVSCRQRVDGRYEIGFQFLGLSDEARREVMAFARAALDSEQLRSRAA